MIWDEISETEFESSQKLRNNLCNTKKLSCIPKEDKIKEENADKANVLTMLRDKFYYLKCKNSFYEI